MSGYISDGYTRTDGYIAAALPSESGERLHESLSFTYRPATRLDVIKIDAEVSIAAKNRDFDPMAAVRAEQIACEFLAKRILAWDLKAAGIHEIKPSADACSRLHPYLFGNLYRIVRGEQASDPRPDAECHSEPTDAEQLKNSSMG
jgi:hypothetical protein